jgi:hypothetical protein
MKGCVTSPSFHRVTSGNRVKDGDIEGGEAAMALFVISIPLMIVAIGIAVVPLVVVSRREVSELVRESEAKFERHRRTHPVRHRAPLERRTPAAASAASRRPNAEDHEPRQRPWHEPVLAEEKPSSWQQRSGSPRRARW